MLLQENPSHEVSTSSNVITLKTHACFFRILSSLLIPSCLRKPDDCFSKSKGSQKCYRSNHSHLHIYRIRAWSRPALLIFWIPSDPCR
ncbi:unnamed protein product [Allacma fusca]|uniref:Uncharacterized protein n=1 Tax=Allacma fusca TaxID=39272 RepID=A0A8J2K9T6_9HEXA|nr:unnamed protein product [Allacma fusca]